MVASELRIGNWVLSLGKDGIWYNSRVSKLNQEEIIVGVGFKREVKPIPLSEEILSKKMNLFIDNYEGVKFFSIGRINRSLEIYFVIVGDTLAMSIRIDLQFIDLGTRVKYLHEFQNLYYFLVGKELEVSM